jgi:Tetratricopeptide repeat
VGANQGGTAIGSFALQPRPQAPGLPVRLAPRPAFLAGRDQLLAEIDARLAPKRGQGGPRVAVLCGLAGAGKTSVAVEYAHRYLDNAHGQPDATGVCWQFAAEDPTVLAAEFAVLAAQQGARDIADTRDPVAAVHAVLARTTAPWLVVFDNVPDLAAVQAFLPPAGPGRVLITSQSQYWPPGWAESVPMLAPSVAARFLAARTGYTDHEAALGLATELDGLPLALEQAAAFMQTTGTSLSGYLSLFQARQSDLLARGEAAGHRQDTAATLALALSRLERDAPSAAGLVRLLAFLAPEPVPLGLLLASRGGGEPLAGQVTQALRPLLNDPVAVWDAVAALRRYSLVSPAGDGLVQVHRLVQAVTRAQVTDSAAEQWKQAAATMVEAALPRDPELPATWPACAALLPHARAVLPLASTGIAKIGLYLGKSGSYVAARDLSGLSAGARRDDPSYGPEHRMTISARHNFAYWTGMAGDPVAARDEFAVLASLCERLLGAEHPDTLAARHNLAYWTGETGDVAGAYDQLAALLPVFERTLGAEHPDTLAARHDLARWAGMTGDAAGARDQFAALVLAFERELSPEHPATLAARHNLASLTGKAGDPAGARDQFAALLQIFERELGPEHPATLAVRRDLAHWTGDAGDAAGARGQFAALLPVAERVLGTEEATTVFARHSVSYWSGQANDTSRGKARRR